MSAERGNACTRMCADKAHLQAVERGYLIGKVEAYCEQIRAGAKLLAELGFDGRHTKMVKEMVAASGCKLALDFRRGQNRPVAHIYKYAFVKRLVETWLGPSSKPPTGAGIWATGKLFGYSDFEIAQYLRERGYARDPLR